jgi:hypothetical protein
MRPVVPELCVDLLNLLVALATVVDRGRFP